MTALPRSSGHRGPLVSILAIAAVLVVAGGAPASATPRLSAGSATAAVTVSLGDAGVFVPGRPAPVRVSVQSQLLVSGQLIVTAGSYQVTEPVEVPGGSNKNLEVVVPTSVNQDTLQVGVSLTERGVTLGGSSATITASPDTEVVGVLPDLLVAQALPGPQPLSIDAGSARFVALSDQDLLTAPGSLGPLSAVATGPHGLGQLSPATLQSLLGWTAGGGELLIDAQPRSTVTGLPSPWQPNGASRVTAGIGQVVFTGAAMTAGQWSGLLDPTSHVLGLPNGNQFEGDLLSTALATDAGVSTPRLAWLIAFLLLYIALVGPVAFLVLRRRRRPELLWVVVPIIAVVFAASGYAVGSSGRSQKLVQGTILNTTVPGGTDLSYVAVLAGGQGTARVDAPDGWVLSRYSSPGNPPQSGAALKAQSHGTGTEATLGLDAGQFAVLEGSGPAGFPGQLQVTATATGDGVAGGVINHTAYTLHDVTVLIGNDGVDVGTLASGAMTKFSVNAATGSSPGIEEQLWGGPSNQVNGLAPVCTAPGGPLGGFKGGAICSFASRGSAASGPVASYSVWDAGPRGLAPGTRGTGVAVAVGWTGSYQPPVTVAGHGRIGRGHTAIVGTALVAPPSAPGLASPTNQLALQRQLVRGNLQEVGPSQFMDSTNSGEDPVVAWQLPPAARGHQLTLSVPPGAGEADVWTAGAWQKIAEASANQGGIPSQGGWFGVSPPQAILIPQVTPATIASAPTTTIIPAPPTTLPPGINAVPLTTVPNQPVSGLSSGVVTAALGPSDVQGGRVFIRLTGQSAGQPFDLDALTITVNP